MSDAPDNHIAISVEDSILRLKFNRPDKKNAITNKMYETMTEAIEASNADPSIRVILFEGSEGCFTSGNDLKDFQDATPEDGPRGGARLIATVPKAEKPIVAAVNGLAIGIGTTLLLHCDLVYASKDAIFLMPFVNLGLVPEFGSSLILPSVLGQRRAAELLLLGKHFTSETALELGIINGILDEGEVLEAALDAARALAAQPPSALRKTKALMRRGLAEAITAQIEAENADFGACLAGPEAAEAFQAFMEKRKPDFSKFD